MPAAEARLQAICLAVHGRLLLVQWSSQTHSCRPSCLFSSTNGAPAVQAHGVMRMPRAGTNAARSHTTFNLILATFQTGRVGVIIPLRTRKIHVRNWPGPTHASDKWRQMRGRSLVGLPKQHLPRPGDRPSTAEPLLRLGSRHGSDSDGRGQHCQPHFPTTHSPSGCGPDLLQGLLEPSAQRDHSQWPAPEQASFPESLLTGMNRPGTSLL